MTPSTSDRLKAAGVYALLGGGVVVAGLILYELAVLVVFLFS